MNVEDEVKFNERATSVVRDFIRTVLVIDDAWPEHNAPSAAVVAPPGMLQAPSIPQSDLELASFDGRAMQVPRFNSADDGAHLLKIEKDVVARGVLFSALRYTGIVQRDQAAKLARRADIVILDWHLIGESSDDALEILARLQQDGGLHFVCVYTVNAHPAEVKQAIVGRIEPDYMGGTDRDFRVSNLIVAVRTKESADGLEAMRGDEIVAAENLYDTAVRSIADNYRGFFQLGLLEVTNRHRDHLPKMLAKFDADHDAAFAYEATHEESQTSLAEPILMLVFDEWRALFTASVDREPMKILSREGVGYFVREHVDRATNLGAGDVRAHLLRALGKEENDKSVQVKDALIPALIRWVSAGFQDDAPAEVSQIVGKQTRLAARWGLVRAILGLDLADEGTDVFLPLVKLEALFQQQNELPPTLRQGTVLKSYSDYLICITPACDAAQPEDKIKHVYSFLVAKVAKVEAGDKKLIPPWCVVKDDGAPVLLVVARKPIVTLRVEENALRKDTDVLAYISYPYTEPVAGEPLKLRPIAQLRVDHALALAQIAASEASRVGLDRGEFMRRRFSSD